MLHSKNISLIFAPEKYTPTYVCCAIFVFLYNGSKDIEDMKTTDTDPTSDRRR